MKADQFPGGVVRRESRFHLPDELLIQIFRRILDLKILGLCTLVSRRFSSLILLHVNSIHYTVPHRTATTTTDPISTPDKPPQSFRLMVASNPFESAISSHGDSFCSAVYFLKKFNTVRSLKLVLPAPPHRHIPNEDSFFRWTAKGVPTIDTFVFRCASSIVVGAEFNFDEQDQEKDQEQDPLWKEELLKHRVEFAFECWKDANVRNRMLCFFIEEHPSLEYIKITDSKNEGSVCLSDTKVVDLRNSLNSLSQTVKLEMNKQIKLPVSVLVWHVPVLKLPVSSKVMINAILVLMEMVVRPNQNNMDLSGDAPEIAHLFAEQDDKEEEEAFAEAVVEMMVNHDITFRSQ